MSILLSHAMWVSVNLVCIAALVPFIIIIASGTKTDVTSKLYDYARKNLPFPLLMMKSSTAPCDVLDPSKVILMNLPCGFSMLPNMSSCNKRLNKLSLHRFPECLFEFASNRHSMLVFFFFWVLLPTWFLD